jgi:hypothetical protein
MEFINKTDLEFTDISSEIYREYDFGGGDKVVINSPLQLHVSQNGHRIFDSAGLSHYIPLGWIHLTWEAREGAAHFVK